LILVLVITQVDNLDKKIVVIIIVVLACVGNLYKN
jgi:hypothetical protein